MKPIYLLMFFSLSARAQRISNTALYRDIQSQHYFRAHYENDYFSGGDKYYTQGINLEQVHPAIGEFFISKLLLHPAAKEVKFGMALEHEGYTPTSITSESILIGDRPFAAALFLKTFSISNDAQRKERIASSLSAGVIGSVAGGKEIQEAIHRWINYTLPLGWQYQIQNDAILNYQMDYERGLFSIPNYFSLSGKASGRIGTFNTKINAGLILMLGYLDDPYTYFSTRKKKWQVYVYAEPLLNAVGHDATLQGGLFNVNPYIILSKDINRIVFQGNIGIVFRINTLQLEYFQSYLDKEFKTGGTHVWGGVRVGWHF